MPVNTEIIRLAYQLFLGRVAESEQAVIEKASRLKSVNEVADEFLNSAEFLGGPRMANLIKGYLEAQIPGSASESIEVKGTNEQLDQLFFRVKEQWTALGDTEPYWSVVTNRKYKSDVVQENLEEFYSSGGSVINLLVNCATRSGVAMPRRSCFELGCGVGRLTTHLAPSFEHVIAADISSGNLCLCRRHLATIGAHNVETVLFESPSDIAPIPSFDVFVSFIVLQHNPPPVQYYLLDGVLSKINPGGLALFQLPTFIPHYKYSIDDHLHSRQPVMDMHCLPMRFVMELLKKHGFSVLEVLQDYWAGREYYSHTFFAVKA